MSRGLGWGLGVLGLAGAVGGLVWEHGHAARHGARLPLYFEHTDHISINCATCHHDYVQARVMRLPGAVPFCVACHKALPDQSVHVAQTFHTLCESCHQRERDAGHRSGPVRDCASCHVAHVLPGHVEARPF
ncbi:hypothetical protein AA103196_1322 [Ameyamaea chiangmaiensis NBRC 103196]|uniref:Cytochrome c3 family protein n=1 Tax=Ameyamaea chiangmaiensis TaxID=442969 RepID=A0A850PC45_9PROT|nr:cytochrome c3 family protein [Ameyamaea chiangmaiensis]MBS4075143.1 cytochrome c3 family protein [Ameyamaea chiangmaiensis]NVN42105.1 cytochrome c3 family protein [Ameyamaea chiangmaiensis]GBQ66220.1 hypothetical protein AA103196_1322 [Ameyamaea chiangmaiensis NBRC 103196]